MLKDTRGLTRRRADIELDNVCWPVCHGMDEDSNIAMARKYNVGHRARNMDYKPILADQSIEEGNKLALLCLAGWSQRVDTKDLQPINARCRPLVVTLGEP